MPSQPPPPLPAAAPVRWEPPSAVPRVSWPMPELPRALARGWRGRCPACGESKLFQGYLRVSPVCACCGAPLGLARADDAPPYFTILVVGHLLVPSMFFVERTWQPALWLQGAVWLPTALALTLLLLRPIKGATIGLMLKLGMLKSDTDE